MTIIRRHHNSHFTVIPNAIFEDSRLSIEAKGALGYLLSRPHDWVVRLAHLGRVLGVGRDKMERIIGELIAAGYVLRGAQRRTQSQQWGAADYVVMDHPVRVDASLPPSMPIAPNAPCPEKPFTAKPHAVFQGTYKGLKDNKTESTNNDADDARARPATAKSMISEIAWQVAIEIGQEAGFATPKDWPPGWLGAPMRIQGFLDGRYPPEVIKLGAITALRKKRDGPPSSFAYLDKPIAEARARAEAPLPEVNISSSPEIINAPRAVRTHSAFSNRRHERKRFLSC
jgi:hypothetical protein